MTKAELVDQVAVTVHLSKAQTDAVLTQCVQAIMEALQAGESVELRGFACFPSATARCGLDGTPARGERSRSRRKPFPPFPRGRLSRHRRNPALRRGYRVRSTPGMAGAQNERV